MTTILVAAVTLFTVASVGILQWTPFKISMANLESGFKLAIPTAAVALAFSAFGITGVGERGGALRTTRTGASKRVHARAAGPTVGRLRNGPRLALAGWTRVMQLDAWFSMVVFTIATVAFYLLGAAVLHPQGLDPKGKEMIPTLSVMYLKPLEGTALAGFKNMTRVGFLLGAWAVLFKTLYVATAANSRLTADFLDLAGIWRQSGMKSRERTIRFFCVLYPALALGLYYAFREPQGLIKVGGIAQGLMLPLITGATLYIRGRDTDRRVGPTFFSDIFSWLAFFAITAVACYSVYDLAGQVLTAGRQ